MKSQWTYAVWKSLHDTRKLVIVAIILFRNKLQFVSFYIFVWTHISWFNRESTEMAGPP